MLSTKRSYRLAWLGPNEVEDSLDAVLAKLSGKIRTVCRCRAVMPAWVAEPPGNRRIAEVLFQPLSVAREARLPGCAARQRGQDTTFSR